MRYADVLNLLANLTSTVWVSDEKTLKNKKEPMSI